MVQVILVAGLLAMIAWLYRLGGRGESRVEGRGSRAGSPGWPSTNADAVMIRLLTSAADMGWRWGTNGVPRAEVSNAVVKIILAKRNRKAGE